MVISNRILFTAVLAFVFHTAHSAITGRVTPSSTMVQQTDVAYTFQLAFTQLLPSDGRLAIRFPTAYADLAFTPQCQVNSVAIACNYIQNVRLLEFTS